MLSPFFLAMFVGVSSHSCISGGSLILRGGDVLDFILFYFANI